MHMCGLVVLSSASAGHIQEGGQALCPSFAPLCSEPHLLFMLHHAYNLRLCIAAAHVKGWLAHHTLFHAQMLQSVQARQLPAASSSSTEESIRRLSTCALLAAALDRRCQPQHAQRCPACSPVRPTNMVQRASVLAVPAACSGRGVGAKLRDGNKVNCASLLLRGTCRTRRLRWRKRVSDV